MDGVESSSESEAEEDESEEETQKPVNALSVVHALGKMSLSFHQSLHL